MSLGQFGIGKDEEINTLPGFISALTLAAKRAITSGDRKAKAIG